MATTRRGNLHDNILGGVDSTLPAHLLSPQQWRTLHNMRMTPALEQIPRKILYATVGATNVRNISMLPSASLPGYGKVLIFGTDKVRLLSTGGNIDISPTLVSNSTFRVFATELYNDSIYYTNDLNPIRVTNGASDAAVSTTAPCARYLCQWFDHLVVGYPTYRGSVFPHRIMISDIYNFSVWEPDLANEADHYDFVEWQQEDYPYIGITGLAKLHGMLFVYTPTAIIPIAYVGKPKVLQVIDSGVITRIGNTHPWSLACLDNLHFFYDGIEQQFWAFDGQTPIPIGEPIRRYVIDNINTDPEVASRMWSYVDVNNREIWWVFISTSSSTFDKAVVFNYRLKRWFTASVENIQAFCGPIFTIKTVGELSGIVGNLVGTCGRLGVSTNQVPRIYGAETGKVYREELSTDATSALLAQEDPVLETGDLHYGDISTKKENDAMSINALWNTTQDPTMNLEVRASGRDYLSLVVDWSVASTLAGTWKPNLVEEWLTYSPKVGKVLRYRFTGKNARGLKFTAFEDAVLRRDVNAQNAEK